MILAVSILKNPSSPADGYRGRFAPSPTGPLHAGSLLAALGSWLDARKNGGQWLLRIEDLDTPRCMTGADQQIQAQLLACGLTWDEELTYQSERQGLYQEALEDLNQEKLLYSCACSRQTIANTLVELGVLTPRNQEIVYPGTCKPAQLKINTPDEIGLPKAAWRLARQIHLQKVLGYHTPRYLHLPLVLDEYGEKLSKQTLATQIKTQDEKHALAELRKAAQYLGLRNLPDGENITIAEWLLAATRAWGS